MQRLIIPMLGKSASVLAMAALLFGGFGPALTVAHAEEGEICSTITLTSGSTTQTAGYTETNPLTAPVSLQAASYSGGAFTSAPATETVIPPWADPASDSDFTSATWVSSGTSWPGGSGNAEGAATNDQWRLFSDSFTLPVDATVTSATVSYASDNAAEVYLNDTSVSSTNDVYTPTPESGPTNYAQATDATLAPVAGENTLKFVVRNWSSTSETNPTGLLYKATIEYCVPDPVEPDPTTNTVTIVKYIDEAPATAESADGAEFPMHATYPGGEGDYALGPVGFNNANPYSATTAEMPDGSDYATNEVTGGEVVGESCSTDQPFSLVGYTTGDTLAEAADGTPTLTSPSFTDLSSDKYVIVWNHDCSQSDGEIGGDVTGGSSAHGVLAVTSIDSTDTTATANGTFTDGWVYTFHITVPDNETNVAMKFANWARNPAPGTIPVAGNMRISSAQADNGGATVLLTAANTYSTPPLHMTTDLDPATPGIQVEVKVEVAVPVGTVNGSYTTNYGVQSLP